MRCKSIFILAFALFFVGIASASFTFSDSGSLIETEYSPSSFLQANVNISFFNQPLNSVFTDSLGNSVELGVLLDQLNDYSYIFYDMSNTTISSAFQILRLTEADFQMPSTEGNLSYQLNLSGEEIFEKSFNIVSASDSIEVALNEKYSKLNVSKSQISVYDIATQNLLNDFLNITSIETNLEELEIRYENAGASEYTEILNNISSIRIPIFISETVNVNSISFYPNRENVNLNALLDIGGGELGGSEEAYIDAVYAWNMNNLPTTLTYREMVASYEDGQQENLKIFIFSFDKSNMISDAYFIIRNLGDIRFEDLTINIGELNGYLYLQVRDVSNSLSFLTQSDTNFIDVPAFISPAVYDLTLPTVGEYEKWQKSKKWLLFGLLIFLIALIGIITYILVQIWYRKKYETHLFKTKNNMYNMMIYIQNSKKRGMQREEILKNLKKSGWSKEQIDYAIRKYEGKKIKGMIHPPMNIGAEETIKKPLRK